MLKTVTITDGREIVLDDLDQISHQQGLDLATAVADVLIRSGQIRDDVALSGPHLMQFLSEMGDWLSTLSEPTVHVVTVTYDGSGPSETIGAFASQQDAADAVVERVATAATGKGVEVTPAQRETLKHSVMLSFGFDGNGYRRRGNADDIALEPIRKAIGWVDYGISDAMSIGGTAEDTLRIAGLVELVDSKRMLRYGTVNATEPYEHEVRIQIVGKPDQDEDSFSAELERLTTGPVVITPRNEDGYLVCTTDDIHPR